jgi:hypothetical protein
MLIRLKRLWKQCDCIVRCGRGHLYRTTVIPWWLSPVTRVIPSKRIQWCPIGRHWTMATHVPASRLTPAEIAEARKHFAW